MKLWSGANFWHQFRARPWKWPAQVLGRFGYCGLMGRSSNAHNFLISEGREIMGNFAHNFLISRKRFEMVLL